VTAEHAHDRQRLSDMVTALDKVERFARHGRDEFYDNELLPGAIVFQLMIVGEAAARLTPELRAAHPEVPWRGVIDMRNTLIHRYSQIDLDIVWQVVDEDVPRLREQIEPIWAELD
jgi:uncharacterized protein with HEPN domain